MPKMIDNKAALDKFAMQSTDVKTLPVHHDEVPPEMAALMQLPDTLAKIEARLAALEAKTKEE